MDGRENHKPGLEQRCPTDATLMKFGELGIEKILAEGSVMSRIRASIRARDTITSLRNFKNIKS